NGAGSFLAARLAARFIDLAETIEIMRQALSTGEAAMDGFATAAATGEGEAFAAVETPRGRLYHWLRIGDEDRVTAYELLAPTEWNFSPAGPLAAALLGADVGAGEEARLRIERLAAVFDPCVAFEVNLSERSHA
ncbi:MAG: nickel-dependent hydrogenase large subunit, partial [Chloroflexota bacterium]